MDLGLAGAHAVVTGGSKGMGRAVAHTFADEGVPAGRGLGLERPGRRHDVHREEIPPAGGHPPSQNAR